MPAERQRFWSNFIYGRNIFLQNGRGLRRESVDDTKNKEIREQEFQDSQNFEKFPPPDLG